MKYVLIALCLSGCALRAREPRQASDQVECFAVQNSVYANGDANIKVLKCHDPNLNTDYEIVRQHS